jgi:hypothetical protein
MLNLPDYYERTYGERRLAALLKKLPKNDYFSIAEPMISTHSGGKYPDFVVVCARYGVAVIEVKDWKAILSANQREVRIKTSKGEILTLDNPLQTARGFALDLADRFKMQEALLTNFQGQLKLRFPWQPIVVLTNISQKDIQRLEREGIWPERTVLGKETLVSAETFEQALRRLTWRFTLEQPLTSSIKDVIRSVIDPSIVVTNTDDQPIGFETVPQSQLIQAPLDLKPVERNGQSASFEEDDTLPSEPTALIKDMSVRLVRGVAGSGKTLVLIRRAVYLHQHFPQYRILALTFNVDLANSLRQRIKPSAVEVTNFHKLCTQILGEKWRSPSSVSHWLQSHALSLLDEHDLSVSFAADEIQWRKEIELDSSDDYLEVHRHGRGAALSRKKREVINDLYTQYTDYQRARQAQGLAWFDWEDVPQLAAAELLTPGHPLRQAYHVILLDEAQDFAPSWMKVIRLLLKPTGTLFVCDDPTQSLFRYFSWQQKGVQVVGRTTVLRVPFRCTREISHAAHNLILADLFLSTSEDITQPKLDSPDLRSGELPLLRRFANFEDEARFIEEQVQAFLQSGLPAKQIAILCHDKDDAKRWRTLERSGVYVATFGKMKGLEFRAVFLPHLNTAFDPLQQPYDEVFVSNQRRRIFTAMTRARDTLVMTYHDALPEALKPIEPYVWNKPI